MGGLLPQLIQFDMNVTTDHLNDFLLEWSLCYVITFTGRGPWRADKVTWAAFYLKTQKMSTANCTWVSTGMGLCSGTIFIICLQKRRVPWPWKGTEMCFSLDVLIKDLFWRCCTITTSDYSADGTVLGDKTALFGAASLSNKVQLVRDSYKVKPAPISIFKPFQLY